MAPPERSTRPAVVLGCVLLLLVAAVPTVAGQQSQPGTDNTVTRIQLSENGTAHWELEIRTRLETEQQVSDYKAFQERFQNNTSTYLDRFRDRMTGVVADAARATGREMRASEFSASTRIQQVPRRWGVVTYSFSWSKFAATEDRSLVVGDVFQGGLFIAENDTLELRSPAGYEITTVEPSPNSRDDGVVRWTGRTDFGDERPRVILTPATAATSQPDESASTDPGPGPTTTAGWLLLVLLALLGTVGVVALTRYRRRPDDEPASADSPAPEAADTSKADSETPERVVTDEERVLALLESNGGRVRQAEIAEALDWSPSKTSRVVGLLAENGSVEKLQLGRENLIELANE